MKYTIEHAGELIEVSVNALVAGRYSVQVGDAPRFLVDAFTHDNLVHVIDGLGSRDVIIGGHSGDQQAHLAGHQHGLEVLDSRAARRRAQLAAGGLGGGANVVRSPMPGRVVSILVESGQTVMAGQGVAIVEAMKMENELRAEIDGVVETVHVNADDRVEGNAQLVTLTPLGEPS